MTERTLAVPGPCPQRFSRRTQVLAGVALVLGCFLFGVSWGTYHPRPESRLAAGSAYRERLIRWRIERMGHQPDVREGARLPLPAATAGKGTQKRTVLLFVGDAPG